MLADLVEIITMGNLLLMLFFTAILSLILGMGLPTTANDIVVSSLLAPVIVTLGQQSGLIVPLIAVHLFVFIVATIAMLLFAAATQGWFLVKNHWWETIALLLITFTLFRPGYWMDKVSPPFEQRTPMELVELFDSLEPGTSIRLRILGEDDVGRERSFVAPLIIGEGETGQERLESTGLELLTQDDQVIIDGIGFDSAAEKSGLDVDQIIQEVSIPRSSLPKQLMFIPALLLMGLIWKLQTGRRETKNKLADQGEVGNV